jgi:transposase
MARRRFQRLRLIWADARSAGQLVQWVAESLSWVLAIVKRPAKAAGFVLLPRRWVVEMTQPHCCCTGTALQCDPAL